MRCNLFPSCNPLKLKGKGNIICKLINEYNEIIQKACFFTVIVGWVTRGVKRGIEIKWRGTTPSSPKIFRIWKRVIILWWSHRVRGSTFCKGREWTEMGEIYAMRRESSSVYTRRTDKNQSYRSYRWVHIKMNCEYLGNFNVTDVHSVKSCYRKNCNAMS